MLSDMGYAKGEHFCAKGVAPPIRIIRHYCEGSTASLITFRNYSVTSAVSERINTSFGGDHGPER